MTSPEFSHTISLILTKWLAREITAQERDKLVEEANTGLLTESHYWIEMEIDTNGDRRN